MWDTAIQGEWVSAPLRIIPPRDGHHVFYTCPGGLFGRSRAEYIGTENGGAKMGDLVIVWALMMALGTTYKIEVSPIRWGTESECEVQRERLENEKQRVQPNYFCVAMLAKR